MKNNKGITLIALVITIIVLLILAGVAIAMLSGNNGILTRASDSKIVNEIGALKDQVNLAASEGITDYYESEYVKKDDTLTSVQVAVANRITSRVVTPNASNAGFTVTCADNTVLIKSKTKDRTYLQSSGDIQENGTIIWTDTFKNESGS